MDLVLSYIQIDQKPKIILFQYIFLFILIYSYLFILININ